MAKKEIDVEGYVYLAEAADGLFKIGHTANPLRRCRTVSRDGNIAVCLVHLIGTDDRLRLEKRLHARYLPVLAWGEWYRLGRADVEFLLDVEFWEWPCVWPTGKSPRPNGEPRLRSRREDWEETDDDRDGLIVPSLAWALAFGARLKAARKAAGLSRAATDRRMDRPAGTCAVLERGRVVPTRGLVEEVADAVRVSPEALLCAAASPA
jgi:hypothetical protein